MTLTWEMDMDGDRDLLRRAFGKTPDCPELPDLVASLERGDATAQRHAAACPHCANEVKLYNQFMSPTLTKEEDAAVAWVQRNLKNPAAAASPWAKLSGWMNIRTLVPLSVAAAAIVVAIGISENSAIAPVKPVVDSVERSAAVELIEPKGAIAGFPGSLRWNSVAKAASYRVKVMEVDKTVVWESTSSSNVLALPPAIGKKALPGKRLIWTVDALDASGKAIASGSQDFRQQLKHSE